MRDKMVFIAGYPVQEMSKDALSSHIIKHFKTSQKCVLLFANTNFIVKCRALKERMFHDDIVIVNDGLGLDIARVLLHKRAFKYNLNGTDFMPYFFKRYQNTSKLRVFLLGGQPEVLNKAAYYLVHTLGHEVVGSCDGYDGIKNATDLVATINQTTAEIVLVAMGNAEQEAWILAHYQQINAQFFAGVGGLFDFWGGAKPRAPLWIQRIRMEWFYRLCLEPKRLYKRYTIDIIKFLMMCIQYRKQGV